jgi:hypothetical protein
MEPKGSSLYSQTASNSIHEDDSLLEYVVPQKLIDVSEVRTASIIRAYHPEPLKHHLSPMRLHAAVSQKNVIFIIIATIYVTPEFSPYLQTPRV